MGIMCIKSIKAMDFMHMMPIRLRGELLQLELAPFSDANEMLNGFATRHYVICSAFAFHCFALLPSHQALHWAPLLVAPSTRALELPSGWLAWLRLCLLIPALKPWRKSAVSWMLQQGLV